MKKQFSSRKGTQIELSQIYSAYQKIIDVDSRKEYDANWHRRMRGEGPYAEMIAQRFTLAVKRLGLDTLLPPMRCDLFRPPKRASAQLDLFGD